MSPTSLQAIFDGISRFFFARFLQGVRYLRSLWPVGSSQIQEGSQRSLWPNFFFQKYQIAKTSRFHTKLSFSQDFFQKNPSGLHFHFLACLFLCRRLLTVHTGSCPKNKLWIFTLWIIFRFDASFYDWKRNLPIHKSFTLSKVRKS